MKKVNVLLVNISLMKNFFRPTIKKILITSMLIYIGNLTVHYGVMHSFYINKETPIFFNVYKVFLLPMELIEKIIIYFGNFTPDIIIFSSFFASLIFLNYFFYQYFLSCLLVKIYEISKKYIKNFKHKDYK